MGNQKDIKESFKDFAEQILTAEPPKSLTAYALGAILDLMRNEGVTRLDERIIRLWLATMVIDGKKVSTCKRYFGKVHSLYNEWTGCATDDVFASMSPVLNGLRDANNKEAAQNLQLTRRLLGRNEKSADWQTVRIFFYLLYNPSASMTDIANLTFDTASRICPQIDEIVDASDATHGRKYVFELKQGKSRPNEISQRLTRDLQSLLTAAGMRFDAGFSRTSITAMWVAAALKLGVALKDIRACISIVPPEYAALSIVGKNDIDEAAKLRIIATVADTINNYDARWYVMKLRQGVSVDDIKESIDEKLPGRITTMTLFYPTRTEIHKEGRKRVETEIPYLPNVLFFKTQANKVKSLFANIGQLAWCFKTSNTPESEYSVISHKQMTNFQQCIGRFTSDIKMELVDIDRPLDKGRRVKVVGGIMAGYEGEIIDVEGQPGQRVFFLAIADNKRARWTAHVDDVFIQPID